MTFIETFTVIVILGVLMGGITALARYSRHAANAARARADIAKLSDVIERYSAIFGEVPSCDQVNDAAQVKDSDFDDDSFAITNLWDLEDLPLPFSDDALVSSNDHDKWDWEENLTNFASNVDPWGHPYRYRPLQREISGGDDIVDDRLQGEDSFEIYSCGPHVDWNGTKPYTNDDIRISL